MKKTASKPAGYKKYLVSPIKSVRDGGWNSPYSSVGLVVALFAVGLLIGFVIIPQVKSKILSSPTLSLRTEQVEGLNVTSDLPSAITKQAVDFLKADLKNEDFPGDLLIGKADKSANTTGQEYVAIWNASGKGFTLLVVVPNPNKPAIYLRVWYTDDDRDFDINASKGLLNGVFNGGAIGNAGDLACSNVNDIVGNGPICGAMKEVSGVKEGVLVRGKVKLSDTKTGLIVSACQMTKDHPLYKNATYCP